VQHPLPDSPPPSSALDARLGRAHPFIPSTLIFASGLLDLFGSNTGQTISFGFVDDTNILVWSPSAKENCRKLTSAHKLCLEWARRHGAVFAPEKYKLIHFTRRRKADVTACTEIPGFDGKPVPNLPVLGVWVDSKLKWSAHVAEAARKGRAQFEALSRLVGSTWGLTFARARALYTAVVRPTITYGCQIWAAGEKGKGLPAATIKPLVQLPREGRRHHAAR
jgi:hypothetical protein